MQLEIINKIRKIFIPVILVCLLACNQKYKQKYAYNDTTDAQSVKVEHLKVWQKPVEINTIGRLSSKSKVPLAFKTGGIIADIAVKEGDRVKKGAYLAALDLTEIKASLTKAQNALDKAKRDFERTENLINDSAATKEQLQNARTALEIAESNYRIARFNRRYSVITAPLTGTILRKAAEEGQMIGSGKPVLFIGSRADRTMVLQVPLADRDVYTIEPGDSALVYFDALPGRKFPATVSLIPDASDPATGAYQVELALEDIDGKVKNGLVGKAVIYPRLDFGYYKIPTSALVGIERGKGKIFVVGQDQKIAHLRKIPPLFIGRDYMAVHQDSLLASDIITEGSAYLTDGATIKILQP